MAGSSQSVSGRVRADSRDDPHPWLGPDVARFRRALLAFFDTRARDLPWRGIADPYAILVSELMLQQTRVETVKPYFNRWMDRFPTIASLAAAEEGDVLRCWEGLGYYSRARNLQSAVREVAAEYDGRIPPDPAALESLPGIGPYTAGAVASIAFGRAVPAIDGNARRVLARLFDQGDPKPTELVRLASPLVDPVRPGAFNQALMELGATVCTPRSPNCPECPVEEHCAARRAGTEEERPARKEKRAVPRVREIALALVAGSGAVARLLVRRRPGRGLLAGMWELPGRAIAGESGGARGTRSIARAATALGRGLVSEADGIETPTPLDPLDHVFSHRRVTYLPYLIRLAVRRSSRGSQSEGGKPRGARRRPGESAEVRWVSRAEALDLPFSVAQRKLIDRVWARLDE